MMKQHIAKISAVSFYHRRQIRRRVGREASIRLVLAMITSRLDYSNSVLAGLPRSATESLQRVQNAAVRLIYELNRHEHVLTFSAVLGVLFIFSEGY